jgi:hypothetical protein
MPETIGRVELLKLSGAGGFVNVRLDYPTGVRLRPVPLGPPTELLIIWSGDQSLDTRDLFTAELSRALAGGLRVRLTHDEGSALIKSLIIEAPFEGSVV